MQIEHPAHPGVMLDVVVVDFETYYASDYTLMGQLSTSEYVRDERFHAHGAAILQGDEATWVTRGDLGRKLRSIDWNKTALLAHNTAFDGFILAHHYGIVPAFYLDTLSMARATVGHHVRHGLDFVGPLLGVGGKVKPESLKATKGLQILTKALERDLGEYAEFDAIRCADIFDKLYPNLPDPELRLIDMTIRMFCDPVLEVDLELVQQELESEVGEKIGALMRAGCAASDLASAVHFERLLLEAGLSDSDIPRKFSVAQNKPIGAFAKSDDGFQDLLNHSNPRVAALAEARLRVKSTIGETRAERFLEAGRDGWKLPILLNYAKAHTYRWSGGNKMNLQNLVRGGRLRRSILAPKGYQVLVADSAQIEARVTGWLANDNILLDGFATMTEDSIEDVYTSFATKIFGWQVFKMFDKDKNRPDYKAQKDARQLGKICILGLGYGMGHKKLDETLRKAGFNLGLQKCQEIVDLYRSERWKIKQLWEDCDRILAHMAAGGTGTFKGLNYGKDWIKLPSGLFLRYPDLRGYENETSWGAVRTEYSYKTLTGRSKIYGALLTENLAQALARCVIGEQMLAASDAGIRVVTMTHDEIVGIVRTEHAKRALANILRIMATAPPWARDLPLGAEGGYDVNYSK